MSLKAKIEAVIYAAEEPVTLVQLAALFQAEALEELRVRLAEQATEAGIAIAAAFDPDPGLGWEPPLMIPSEIPPAEMEGDEVSADEAKQAARLRDREVREELRRIVNELVADYSGGDHGVEIREIAGGYRVATKAEYHDAVRGFVKSLKPPMKLSLPALETLAVIAYKQPVTAPEVSEIRGVDSGGVLGSLISRKLITTAGRKHVIGRPILYKTTKEFLLRFGLKDLNELPSMEEFEKMAGELAESEILDAPEQLQFVPGDAETDDEGSGSAESNSDPGDSEIEAAAVAAVGVSEETGSSEYADLPGVAVEAEVKPTSMVDAGEATATVGQPGEGD